MSFSVQNAGVVADFILFNAKLFIAGSTSCAVAIRDGWIIGIGSNTEMSRTLGKSTETIDCKHNLLLPGFVDSHCHTLGMASSLVGVDCGPDRVDSRESLIDLIRKRADQTSHEEWIKGFGYDESNLEGFGHPTRWDLDKATINHPVRLDHRSGHATVLNSKALDRAGIFRDTPDPMGGIIDRDNFSGEPTGVIYESNGFLRDAIGDTKTDEEFKLGVHRLNQRFVENGITSINDAGYANGWRRWNTFGELRNANLLRCRVSMMVGEECLPEINEQGLSWGSGDSYLWIGHVKLMLTMTTGLLTPDYKDLVDQVVRAHNFGFPVAIHAVEEEAVRTAVNAISNSRHPVIKTLEGKSNPNGDNFIFCPIPRDRIEHCSECPPSLLESIKKSGVVISTQPGFLYWNGDRYLESVDPLLLPSLYPIGELSRFGIPLSFGSDGPVIPLEPWYGIYSAVTGLSRQGHPVIGPDDVTKREGVSLSEALKAYSYGGALAEGTEHFKGHLKVGHVADMILLRSNFTDADPIKWLETEVLLTMIGGQIVWENPK